MRRADISITKAIGIIFMVVGHSGCPKLIHDIIYQFHMPLFFIMAGMCLSESHIKDIPNFIKRKLSGIWWPYVKYSLIFLVLHNLFFHLNIYSEVYGYEDSVSSLYTVQDYIRNLTKIFRMTASEQLLGGFWFLHALFWASIISVIILKSVRQKWMVLIFMFVVTILMRFLKLEVPIVGISSTTFLAATFFVIGYYFKNISLTSFIYAIAIVAVVLGVMFGAESIHISDIRLIIPYVIIATLSTLAVYKFSQIIAEKFKGMSSILLYIGDNTLSIFIWHLICFKVVSLMIIVIYDLPWVMLSKFPIIEEYSATGWWVVYTVLGINLSLFLGYLFTLINLRVKRIFSSYTSIKIY